MMDDLKYTRRSITRAAALVASLLAVASLPLSVAAAAARPAAEATFSVDDYMKLKRILHVALSPDGKMVAYVVQNGPTHEDFSQWLSNEEKRSVRSVDIQSVAPGKQAVAVDALADADALEWIAGSRELAFLSARNGVSQVFSYDTVTHEVRQRTQAPDPVLSFKFTKDGKSFAYVTQPVVPSKETLYSRFLNGDRGIVMNSNSLSVYDFVDPNNPDIIAPARTTLHVMLHGEGPYAVAVPGQVGSRSHDFHWSSDGKWLSVVFVGDDVAASLVGTSRSSVGLADVTARQFRTIAKAAEPTGERAGLRYLGGEWVPGRNRLLIRRVTETDAWVSPSYPDWALVDASASGVPTDPAQWHPTSTYGSSTIFTLKSDAQILVEKTHEGVHSLFDLSPGSQARSQLVAGVDGGSKFVKFSDDFSTVAFVNESHSRPPELFVRQGAGKLRKLTSLNTDIASHVQFTWRDVSWKSSDGVLARGWLLEPAGLGKGPWPMITHVHGGPGFAVDNSFAPYFAIWPFPFEVLAGRGTAIFVPNYRGTHTYGRSYADPQRTDREPVEDVVTGVRELIAQGVADPRRLGITGQSHGAWLGPLVMTKEKIFRASSFAEGSSSQVLMYSLMPGDLNRQVHDPITGRGVSFWDDPTSYYEASPDVHFKGVRTASLWEAGAQSQAVLMFSYPKAARHFGAPTEFVVYPQTWHNPHRPSVLRESAERNLDWFEYWLKDVQHEDPVKAEQYRRWGQLRAGSTWAAEYACASR